MAGYGYAYRGGYTTYGGVAPRADGWSKTSYTSDHVCQPMMIDAEGRRKPIISYTPDGNTECYVTKTEIVEHVPLVIGYKQNTPARVEVLMDYNDHVEDKRNRPSSPEKWRRPSSPVHYHAEEKWNRPSSPEKWRRPSSPVRYHAEEKWNRPSSPEKWRRPSSPVRYQAEEKWSRPSTPVHERPKQVEEFITKVQTDASRPNKFGPLTATYWRQTPNPHPVNTGYGDQSDFSNKGWQKANGNTIRNENYDAWGKPSHGAWSTGQGANLSQPTSDIGTAVAYLKEAAKPSSGIAPPPPSRYTVPVSTGPKRDSYSETIDSREAARRYGNSNLAARPMDNYGPTIDSREAARKYGGTTV